MKTHQIKKELKIKCKDWTGHAAGSSSLPSLSTLCGGSCLQSFHWDRILYCCDQSLGRIIDYDYDLLRGRTSTNMPSQSRNHDDCYDDDEDEWQLTEDDDATDDAHEHSNGGGKGVSA